VQSAVLRSHVVCPSVRPSVPPSVCNVGELWSHRLEFFENLVSLGCSLFATPTWRVCSEGNTPKFWPKVTHPLLIWALETFDCKLLPNGYTQHNGHNGEPIGNHHRSFEWCHCWPPTTSPSPKWGFHMPITYANGHISATGDPIHFIFCSMVWFSGASDLMALFAVRTDPRWRPPPSWKNFNGHISTTAHDLLI